MAERLANEILDASKRPRRLRQEARGHLTRWPRPTARSRTIVGKKGEGEING